MTIKAPHDGDNWIALCSSPLPLQTVVGWVIREDCGALVLFNGTTRDHADDRVGVTHLEYEAYEEPTLKCFADIVQTAHERWPMIGRVALLHRVGVVELGESAVLVAVSAPHRAEAFDAARFCIDTLKQVAPIWKHETWDSGSGWGNDAQDIRSIEEVCP